MKFQFSFVAIFVLILTGFSAPLLAAQADATLKGTAEGSLIEGKVLLEEKEGGLYITAILHSAPPGKHGFHIHEKGSCAELGNAAGGHYNPHSAPHGHLIKDGVHKAHAGDMGNITVDKDGIGVYEGTLPGLKLNGDEMNVLGRAIILHEKEDDFGQPLGNAGGRIACGVIEAS